jgi:hypothetical protein
MRSSKEGPAQGDWPGCAPQVSPHCLYLPRDGRQTSFIVVPSSSEAGDAILRPHYSYWRCLACDRRIFGTRILFDIFLSSQFWRVQLHVAPYHGDSIADARESRGWHALPLRYACVIPPLTNHGASSRPHITRLTTRIEPKMSVDVSIAVSVCGRLWRCVVFGPQFVGRYLSLPRSPYQRCWG